MSAVEPAVIARFTQQLTVDLLEGTWDATHGELRTFPRYEGSLVLVVAESWDGRSRSDPDAAQRLLGQYVIRTPILEELEQLAVDCSAKNVEDLCDVFRAPRCGINDVLTTGC